MSDSIAASSCRAGCCGGRAITLEEEEHVVVERVCPSGSGSEEDNATGGDKLDGSSARPASPDSCCKSAFDEQESCAPAPCAAQCEGESQAKPDISAASPQDNCCGTQKPNAGNCCSGTLCSTTAANVPVDCQDDCCSPAAELLDHENATPSCCKGKANPCCDVTCIDRLMSREYPSENVDKDEASTLRSNSRAATRQRYADRLAALGCICRALIALGQESCCIPKKQDTTPANAAYSDKRISIFKDSRRGCCSQRRRSSPSRSGDSGSSTKKGHQDSCCAGSSKVALKDAPSCKQPGSTNATLEEIHQSVRDPEKGFSKTERVVLSIGGMTCTGCETKLRRVLGNVSSITNLKASLVMARAEFSLELETMSVDDVIKYIERTTEFKCQRIITKGSTIDVSTDQDARILSQHMPLGVNDIEQVTKGLIRINFEPETIGARDLLQDGFGQPLQLAPPTADAEISAGDKHVRELGHVTLLSCVLTVPVLVLAWAPLPQHDIPYAIASLVLATIIQLVVAGPFYPKAIKSLVFSRILEMDLLIVLSTSAAYIFSVISFGYLAAGKPLSTGEFFETSTLLVSLIMVGRWVGALARQKAIKSISIRSLQPAMAMLTAGDNTVLTEIDSRLLQYGDVFCVLPEQRIPTDGIIISGETEVDESMLTGESRPIDKQPGSSVIAGSINGSGRITVRLTRLPGDNTISTIAGMVEEAKLSKMKIQDLADKVATYFVPVVILLTVLTFIIWIAVGIQVRKYTGSEAAIQAITFSITVLIVSCPCAIGLAVPMVIVIGTGVAAEHGIIFKAAESIEIAHKATHVVFDKTGTLTEGKLTVAECHTAAKDDDMLLSRVLGLVANNKHPVSAAITEYLLEQGVVPAPMDDIKTISGKGVEASASGHVIRGGNIRWLNCQSDSRAADMQARGLTVFCIVVDSHLSAVFGLTDTVRTDAAATISELKERGLVVSLLSGDNDGAVTEVANKLGIDPANVRSHCSPANKREYIQSLLQTRIQNKPATVIFVGDGTNDAVALAQASIGVHMNSGTDAAQSAASVVLINSSLGSIITMIDVSRASVHRIMFNFGWAFIYNTMAVLLACGALVAANGGRGIRIPPEYAGLGELVSVLPVIFIALSLRWIKL